MNDAFRDLALLNRIEKDPDVSQATLAEDLNIAIGTVNWHLKRLVEKGFINVKRAQRRKLCYLITAEGLALQKTLTDAYVCQSFQLYRKIRQQLKFLLAAAHETGLYALRLDAEGDIADICRLTCIEQGIAINDTIDTPVLVVDGLDIRLEWDGRDSMENDKEIWKKQ